MRRPDIEFARSIWVYAWGSSAYIIGFGICIIKVFLERKTLVKCIQTFGNVNVCLFDYFCFVGVLSFSLSYQ